MNLAIAADRARISRRTVVQDRLGRSHYDGRAADSHDEQEAVQGRHFALSHRRDQEQQGCVRWCAAQPRGETLSLIHPSTHPFVHPSIGGVMCRNDGARYAGGSVEPHEPLARGCVVCHHVQGLEPQLSPYICNDDDTDDGDDDDAAWTRLQVPHPSTPEPTSGAGTAAGSRAELLASLAVRGVLALACSLSLSILTRARSLALAHIHSRNRSFASISKGSMPSSRRCSCPRTTPSSLSITRSPRSVCLRTRQALVCASCISMRCWTIAPHVRYLSSLPLVRGVVSCTRSALAHRPSHARTLRGRYTPS